MGTNSVSHAPVFDCDRVYLVSETSQENFRSELMDIIIKENPDLVIPSRDAEINILSSIKEEFKNASTIFLVGPNTITPKIQDKWLSAGFSKEYGLPFADSALCHNNTSEELLDELSNPSFPLIAKPRNGFASQGVLIIYNKSQLEHLSQNSNYVIQEYLGDPSRVSKFTQQSVDCGLPLFYSFEETKFSLQLFFDGKTVESFITKHLMVNGISRKIEHIHDTKLDEILQRIKEVFTSVGWFGPLNIQMQRSARDGMFKTYEYNGRYTGATAARYFLGFDEIGFALKLLGLNENTDDDFNSHEEVFKTPRVHPINPDFSARLKQERVWSNPLVTSAFPLPE